MTPANVNVRGIEIASTKSKKNSRILVGLRLSVRNHESHKLHVAVTAIYPLANAAKAHKRLEEGHILDLRARLTRIAA